MAARIQQLIVGLSKAKQADIATVAASFIRFKKLDTDATDPHLMTEDDAAETGKGHEFATQTFLSHYDVANKIEKYATAEFATWAIAHGLGNIVQTGSGAPYTYTITPIDPGTTLELPYCSVVEQVAEGGGQALDNVYIGCAVEEFVYSFNYGPGRASSRLSVNWVGSGNGLGTSYTDAGSGITVPALVAENNMLAAGMALTVNGVNYVSSGRILSGSIGWKNNLLLNAGFFPGSGTKNGAQIRGRLEIGPRTPSFQFMARLLHGSTEYNTLVAQSTGTAVLSVQHDSGNSLQFTWQKMAFKAVEQGLGDGIVAVTVTGMPEYDPTNGILTVVAKCGIAGIAQ
jgi:hypothetical protein